MKFNLKFHLLHATALAVLILIGVYCVRGFELHGGALRTGISSTVANQYLLHSLKLPDAASDVSVYVDFGAAESEFAITEDAFLEWSKANGWLVNSIIQPVAYFESIQLPSDPRLIIRGYVFEVPNGQGVFDADRSRACLCTSTFP